MTSKIEKKKSHYILLTAVVDDFQVHSGGGLARVAERCRVRRQPAVSFAVTYGHYGLRRVTDQTRYIGKKSNDIVIHKLRIRYPIFTPPI